MFRVLLYDQKMTLLLFFLDLASLKFKKHQEQAGGFETEA